MTPHYRCPWCKDTGYRGISVCVWCHGCHGTKRKIIQLDAHGTVALCNDGTVWVYVTRHAYATYAESVYCSWWERRDLREIEEQ